MPKTKKPMYLNIPMSLHEEYRQKHFPNLTDFMTRSSMFRGAKITLTHGSLQNIAGNISNFCSKKKQKNVPKTYFSSTLYNSNGFWVFRDHEKNTHKIYHLLYCQLFYYRYPLLPWI